MSKESKYWEEKANRLEKDNEDNEQMSGCFALLIIVIAVVLLALL